ncbi:hypothetical protein INT44_003184 [Umbelopsis vinacea]|uniref:Alpha-soluble NSF attachment protein n=1 Tax=Umbelopsis vinacea TaxID=44442 RepID=A0A8H7Q710_9FUNG|nr:hypothetical protein INT44_003184 [Umbelopsis vinacea]KAI9288205.1 soluble NSF attachment protein [Umbelopsis sp. AD052]
MSEQQARAYMEQAKEKLGAWSMFWSSSDSLETAAELYIKAGNSFQLASMWQEAGDAYVEAAKLFKRADHAVFEAARSFEKAAKSYKKVNPKDALTAMIAAVALDKANGSYRIAARHLEEVAQIYQDKLDEPQKAYDYYDEAANLYHADNSPTLANRCTLKAAELAAILAQYDHAITKFENVAFASIDDTLLSWSVKEYFLQAALCHICTKDYVASKKQLEKYADAYVGFDTTREYELLNSILRSVEDEDVDAFTQHVYDYDKLTKLDNWKTTILLRIKRSVTDDEISLR